jgi:hypothetical protein
MKEPPKMQEMGPKKYGEMVRKQNKFYDDHMAGKRDRKTGEYYYHIDTKDPTKPVVVYNRNCTSTTIGYVNCTKCNEEISVGSNSTGKCCLYCGELNLFSAELKEKLTVSEEAND